MGTGKQWIIIAGLALAVNGCSFAEENFWPGSSSPPPPQPAQSAAQAQGQQAQGQDVQRIAIEPSQGEVQGQPWATPGTPTGGGGATGTVVGARVAELGADLQGLRQSIGGNASRLQEIRQRAAQNAQTYNASVSDVRARLQVGTTPGNPEVIAQWNAAQNRLDAVNADIGAMTNLANDINRDATTAAFLLDAVRSSYSLAGGVDADHRNLEQLENQSVEALQQAEQMQAAINGEIAQQAAYVSSERQNLTTLAQAIDKGRFLNAPLAGRAVTAGAYRGQVASASARRPLVVIKFDRASVNYEEPLYSAIGQALQRVPNAQFDVVAVSPSAAVGSGQASARRHAEGVMRSITGAGVSADRVTMSATSSPAAATDEVHVFVR